MRILIINPNSDERMTDAIRHTSEEFAGGHEIICRSTPNAPRFIETYEDEAKAARGMIQLVRDHTDADAIIVACHCDPNLDLMKEIASCPVVGIGEASMKIATMLGHRFSVVAATVHSLPNKEALIRKYHLQDLAVSVRAVSDTGKEGYREAAQTAVEKDGAEVIVLGCAGMTGVDRYLEKNIGVPVLDGVICALIIAAGLAKYGLSISRRRRYDPMSHL